MSKREWVWGPKPAPPARLHYPTLVLFNVGLAISRFGGWIMQKANEGRFVIR